MQIFALKMDEEGRLYCEVGDPQEELDLVGVLPTEEFVSAIDDILTIEAAKTEIPEFRETMKLALSRLKDAWDKTVTYNMG